MLDNVSLLLLFLLFRSFCWRSEKKQNVNERLKKEHKSLKSKVQEERYIKEEKDKMAIEAFENWLVSHTSINMSFQTVSTCWTFLLVHFYTFSCWRFLNIQILFFRFLLYFSFFPTRHENVSRKRKEEERRVDLGTHQVQLHRSEDKE